MSAAEWGSQVCSYQGPSVVFQDSDLRSVDGSFVAVCISNVPWDAGSVMAATEAKVISIYARDISMSNMYRADQEQKFMGELLGIFPYVQHVHIRPKTYKV